jgi:hypothetical protein
MCGHVTQAESVSTVLGVLSCIYADHSEDASLLMDLYARDAVNRGATDNCVLASMFSASVFVTMSLLGEQGADRVEHLNLWWAAQCPS